MRLLGKTLLVLTLITLLFCGCTGRSEGTESFSLKRDHTNFDELLQAATDIVIGYVVEENEFDGGSGVKEFVVEVESYLRSSTDSDIIHVYDDKVSLGIELGHRYVMFLEIFDAPFYPQAIYTSVDKQLIYRVNSDNSLSKLVDKEWVDGKATVEQLKDYITEVSSNRTDGERLEVVDSFPTVNDRINYSDLIVNAKVIDYFPANNYVTVVQIEVADVFKGGSANSTFLLNIPAHEEVKVGSNYMFFLTDTIEHGANLATSYGSVLSPDKEEWKEAQQILR